MVPNIVVDIILGNLSRMKLQVTIHCPGLQVTDIVCRLATDGTLILCSLLSMMAGAVLFKCPFKPSLVMSTVKLELFR